MVDREGSWWDFSRSALLYCRREGWGWEEGLRGLWEDSLWLSMIGILLI